MRKLTYLGATLAVALSVSTGRLRAASVAPSASHPVDEFGQRQGADWPGKLHSAEQLRTRRDRERGQLRHRPSDLDPYGGWLEGPNVQATGNFRTKKLLGKWWLLTPDGHLFFSIGVDRVDAAQPAPLAKIGHPAWLPGERQPLHDCLDGHRHTFDFYQANLERKFGSGWTQASTDEALSRLVSWGCNTLGYGSAPRLYGNGHVAYAATLEVVERYSHAGSLPDPFDPRFGHEVGRAALAQSRRSDPYCIGYFVDDGLDFNESQQRLLLHADARRSPAKRAWIALLRRTYTQPSALTAAWGVPGWEQLEASYEPPSTLSEAQKQDFRQFMGIFARQYFQVVREALHRADPNHLYLGCHLGSWTQPVLDAAAEYCDVVSFRGGAANLKSGRWNNLRSYARPCIVDESNPGAADRGLLTGGPAGVADQRARASYLKDALTAALEHPAMVGAHLFEYSDPPLAGRDGNGDSANDGFVDVTDTPYPEMVEAMQAVGTDMYPHRYALLVE